MAIRPNDLLGCAESLAQQTTEPELRASVNRAYYAVYHTALDACQRHGYSQPSKIVSVHIDLINFIETQHKSLADKLNAMRRLRGIADYRLDRDISSHEAIRALAECKRLISAVSKTYP